MTMLSDSKDQIFSLSPETENSGKIFSSNWNTKNLLSSGNYSFVLYCSVFFLKETQPLHYKTEALL